MSKKARLSKRTVSIPVFLIGIKHTDHTDFRINIRIVIGICIIIRENKFNPLCTAGRGILNDTGKIVITLCFIMIICKNPIHLHSLSNILFR